MSRKYTTVNVHYGTKCLRRLMAFYDSGADRTVVSTRVARKLGLDLQTIELGWFASDGDKRRSPVVELNVKATDDRKSVRLDLVLVDDSPMDRNGGEEVILGLDYLQKAKKVLSFKD